MIFVIASGGQSLAWVPANISRVRILMALAKQAITVKAYLFLTHNTQQLQKHIFESFVAFGLL